MPITSWASLLELVILAPGSLDCITNGLDHKDHRLLKGSKVIAMQVQSVIKNRCHTTNVKTSQCTHHRDTRLSHKNSVNQDRHWWLGGWRCNHVSCAKFLHHTHIWMMKAMQNRVSWWKYWNIESNWLLCKVKLVWTLRECMCWNMPLNLCNQVFHALYGKAQ